MKKIYGRSLKRALALSVALVMSLTPAGQGFGCLDLGGVAAGVVGVALALALTTGQNGLRTDRPLPY